MNKIQKNIYTWLLKNPGYLKKSAAWLQVNLYYNKTGKDIEIALKQARIDSKPSKSTYKVDIRNNQESIVKKPKIEDYPDYESYVIAQLEKQPSKNRNTPGTYYVTGCAHAPWQNKKMYDSVFNYLNKEVELQGLVLAGDIVDLNSLSSHDKGKIPLKGVDLDWEYKESNKFLDQFDDLSIKGTKDYIWGNHEDRYNRISKDSDMSKMGSALISPIEGLNLKKRGYNVYTDWKNDSIHIGKHLDIVHGEFLNVHSAKKTIDTYRKSVLYFHTHRFQIYVEGLVGGFNMGFGADINAPIFGYATRAMKNSWINSSCLVNLDSDGFYHVEPLMYINNKLIINGKSY